MKHHLAALALIGGLAIAATGIAGETFATRGGRTEVKTESYDNGEWFIADSFSFGVEREMKASAPPARGVVTLTLPADFAGRDKFFAMFENETEIPSLTLAAPGTDERGRAVYLKYKLERCFIKSWSTSGDGDDRPTEDVAFYYNKIAFGYAKTRDGAIVRAPGDDLVNGTQPR